MSRVRRAFLRWTLWAFLGFLYGFFLVWHEGRSPLTGPQTWPGPSLEAEETNLLMDRLEGAERNETSPSGGEGERREETLNAMRLFAETDDGKPFFMVNLIKHRQEPVYPEGFSDPKESVEAADSHYSRSMILNLLLPRGSYPVFAGRPTGFFVSAEEVRRWDTVAVVRYRSRRDFLEIISSPEFAEYVPHKWASVEETEVFPVESVVFSAAPRLTVFLIIFALGVFQHYLLRSGKRGGFGFS